MSVESPDELALVARSSVLITFLVIVMRYLKKILREVGFILIYGVRRFSPSWSRRHDCRSIWPLALIVTHQEAVNCAGGGPGPEAEPRCSS